MANDDVSHQKLLIEVVWREKLIMTAKMFALGEWQLRCERPVRPTFSEHGFDVFALNFPMIFQCILLLSKQRRQCQSNGGTRFSRYSQITKVMRWVLMGRNLEKGKFWVQFAIFLSPANLFKSDLLGGNVENLWFIAFNFPHLRLFSPQSKWPSR
jgi:hypothetical protein